MQQFKQKPSAFCHLPFFDLPVHVSPAFSSDAGWIQSQVPFPSYKHSSGLFQLSLKIHSTNNNKNLKVIWKKKKKARVLLQTSATFFIILPSSHLPSLLIILTDSQSVSLCSLLELRCRIPLLCLTEGWQSWIQTQYFVPHYCPISSRFSAFLAWIIYMSIKV